MGGMIELVKRLLKLNLDKERSHVIHDPCTVKAQVTLVPSYDVALEKGACGSNLAARTKV